jgi:hypothetical protein
MPDEAENPRVRVKVGRRWQQAEPNDLTDRHWDRRLDRIGDRLGATQRHDAALLR